MTPRLPAALGWLVLLLLAGACSAQQAPAPAPAAQLYHRLASVGLDPQRVYRVRDAALDREDLHLSLSNGTLAFTESVDGHVTGAFFEGDGDILLAPPTQVERASLARFTGAAILNESFSTAFFRFNDDTYAQLLPDLRPLPAVPVAAEDAEPGENVTAAQFVERWNPVVRSLAETNALRLVISLTAPPSPSDRMLYARLGGDHLGTFDVFFDAAFNEQISVYQMSYQEGTRFYDIWTSFPMRSRRPQEEAAAAPAPRISAYKIRVHVLPSHELEAEAELTVQAGAGGRRVLAFELSRYLRVTSATANGQPVEVLQNESLEGSELARRGNDVVAVVLPRAPAPGQTLALRFLYSGSVLSEAGGGLMYVGARGDWYPNLGPTMADFDLEFRYPSDWTLLATGKRISQDAVAGEQVARWISQRPIPLAGFNLGRYSASSAQAGDVLVETYSGQGMESDFPRRKALVLPANPRDRVLPPVEVVIPPPAPSATAHLVAERAARTIDFLSQRIAPFPYSSLIVSQQPGPHSQGWPGLVFLSSYSFLPASALSRSPGENRDAALNEQLVQAHETAHQWWGDAVMWKSYHDEWMMEGLSNYCALLALEAEHPADFRALMQQYRLNLLRKNKDDRPMHDAGPVSAGTRLNSSRFPDGYKVVAYDRGTWIFHMLRSMLRDASAAPPEGRARGPRPAPGGDPFFQVLAGLYQRFQGRELSTADLQHAFEAALPPALRYEGRPSLDWFFSGWVDGTAVPRLELKDVRFLRQGGKRVVTATLRQEEAPESLVTSVPIYAAARGGKPVFLGRVFADGPETSLRLAAPATATKLLLDPYQTVLTRP
jgi:hypothetical protein